MNVMSKNIHKNFEFGPAKSGQITKMDNVFFPTSSIPNYGLDYLTKVDNFSKCLTVPITQISTIAEVDKIEISKRRLTYKTIQTKSTTYILLMNL